MARLCHIMLNLAALNHCKQLTRNNGFSSMCACQYVEHRDWHGLATSLTSATLLDKMRDFSLMKRCL